MLEVTGRADHSHSDGEKTNAKGFEVSVEIPISTSVSPAWRRRARPTCRPSTVAREGRQRPLGSPRSLRDLSGAYDIAQTYQTKILPLRKIIEDKSQLQYNGMLVDTFAVVDDRARNVARNVAAINAKRDLCHRRHKLPGRPDRRRHGGPRRTPASSAMADASGGGH